MVMLGICADLKAVSSIFAVDVVVICCWHSGVRQCGHAGAHVVMLGTYADVGKATQYAADSPQLKWLRAGPPS